MCSHYQTLKDAELLLKKFGAPNAGRWQVRHVAALPGIFIRRPVEHDAGDEAVPEREALVGRWGHDARACATTGWWMQWVAE